ncbi:polyphosphate kinase [Yersinia mollaretii]|uniref:polyphosphate kinase n=1 Tax=Yersinia mollaretii TaxID=33060 RepID=UPI0011A1630B|nr:polyphosphate kinase [Yersinia mollaretii]
MLSKNKREYPTGITNAQLKYLITAFENNMAEFYPVGREAQIARELLSQRERNLSLSRQLDVMTAAAQALRDEMYKGDEKLAALAALPAVGYVGKYTLGALEIGNVGDIVPNNAFGEIPLFAAVKPDAMPRHIFSMLVNELRDVQAIGCKRELIVGVLNRHGVIAEPMQCDPPATE